MQMERHFRIKDHLEKIHICWNDQVKEPHPSTWFDSQKRPDVITTTEWDATIIWEGTYKRQILEKYYKRLNITIGLVVYAPAKLANRYLKQFLQSAEKHFMVGYHVIFYLLIDDKINTQSLSLKLGPLRTFKACNIYKEKEMDIDHFTLMSNLNAYVIDAIQFEVNYVFIMAVNQIFKSDFGVETLGRSIAQLHSWWYFQNTKHFPYERRKNAASFIPYGEGDFYYHSAIWGGTPHEVLNFTKEYQRGFYLDNSSKLNSEYEKYLNKYFFENKPTKLLSPEYNWDPAFKTPPQIKQVKIAWQPENS
ncbi:N-acetyllactosaminide alpha-1,3-galactosyltransferase-like 1 [Ochotona curzoniae]|uniref:N-acetyllactosaminide alpha-1,3-galactosyltransferase-like 1 n=1 Tax=Ochotona curzoniae TaxID=130825 RepID=UPI001B347EB1|nr:N-acetyllactosaminide alpha-1,3-galactosyltransferase-like 1 [Ochotona curzoniae]